MDRGCENSGEWNESRVTVPDAAREEMKSQVNRGPLREARLLERGGFTTDSFHFEDLAIEVGYGGKAVATRLPNRAEGAAGAGGMIGSNCCRARTGECGIAECDENHSVTWTDLIRQAVGAPRVRPRRPDRGLRSSWQRCRV